jgi:uncharacterized protein YhfF
MWGFADPGPLRDELTAAALAGAKTTTASLLAEFEMDDAELPKEGQRDVLVDSAGRPVAVVETISCRISRLADVDDQHAIDEGEGYADAAEFRVAHEGYWNSYIDQVRSKLGDPTFALDDDTPVVLERFRIVERLDPGEAG